MTMVSGNQQIIFRELSRWGAIWSNSAPVANELRYDWAERWLRLHSMKDHGRLPEDGEELEEAWARFQELYVATFGGPVDGIHCFVVGESCVEEFAPTSDALGLASGVFFESWLLDPEDAEGGNYPVWLHKNQICFGKLRPLFVSCARDRSMVTISDLEFKNLINIYDGGFNIFSTDQSKLDKLAIQYESWLPPQL